MTELVSIITPTYNSEIFISDTIRSIQNQTYDNWELLITDDNSTDNTVKIIKELSRKDHRIKLYCFNENKGPASARNNSIHKAKGKFIVFLDSDDLWKSEKLTKQVNFANQNPFCPLFYTAYDYINVNGEKLKTQPVPIKVNYEDMLRSCSIGCLTAMINLNITGKVYMPLLKKRQDYALWLKILREYNYALGLQESLACYRVGGSSVSSNKIKVIKYQWETYYKVEKLGVFKSIYYLINWAIFGFFKYYIR